jgi:hypothetical protein
MGCDCTADTGATPTQMSADSGYCPQYNIQAIETFIATGRHKHGEVATDGGKT